MSNYVYLVFKAYTSQACDGYVAASANLLAAMRAAVYSTMYLLCKCQKVPECTLSYCDCTIVRSTYNCHSLLCHHHADVIKYRRNRERTEACRLMSSRPISSQAFQFKFLAHRPQNFETPTVELLTRLGYALSSRFTPEIGDILPCAFSVLARRVPATMGAVRRIKTKRRTRYVFTCGLALQ